MMQLDFYLLVFLAMALLVAYLAYKLRLLVKALRADLSLTSRIQEGILKNASDSIIVLDEKRRVVTLNPAAEQLTGWSVGESAGIKECLTLCRCQDEDGHLFCGTERCWGARVLSGQAPFPYVEMYVQNRSGGRVPVTASCFLLPLEEKRRFIALILRDMSEKRLYEGELARLGEEARVHQERLAVLAERNRIAGEMHDDVAQKLGYLNLKLQRMEKTLSRRSSAEAAELSASREVLREAFAGLRRSIYDLRAPEPSAENFQEIIRNCLQSAVRQGVEVDLSLYPEACAPPTPEAGMHLARLLQEAVSNALRHGQADRVIVRLVSGKDNLWLFISDNGNGFDPKALSVTGNHVGLEIMHDRVRRLDGTIEIVSSPGEGTRIIVSVPLGLKPLEGAGGIGDEQPHELPKVQPERIAGEA
ncbi:MAG: PAS domain S-box protein [Firmicutes bacterium]|nr:PAS domain S-box protein [Bacillota bacterium]